jgi:hypothetical protein
MRLLARFVIGVFVVLLIVGAALYFLRKPIAAATVEHIMTGVRLQNPAASVSDITLSRLSLSSVTAGSDRNAPDIALDGVVLEYNWRDLVFRGKTKAVALDGGKMVARIEDGGAINVAGWSPDPAAKPAPPPFATLTVKTLELIARTPKGDLDTTVSGAFDMAKGGHFDAALSAEETGFAALGLSALQGEGAVDLAAGGSIEITGAIKSGIATPAGAVRGADLVIDANIASWRGVFGDGPRGFTGDATVALKSSTIDALATPTLAPYASAGGGPIKDLSVAGVFRTVFSRDGFTITLADGPMTVIADRGDRLTVSSGDAALYGRRNGKGRVSLRVDLAGPVATGGGSVDAFSEGDGPWRIDAAASLGGQRVAGVSIANFAGQFKGAYSDRQLNGAADIAAEVKKVEIGRLQISDMPARARLSISVDPAAKTLTATPVDGGCVEIERAGFLMGGQDMDGRMTIATLCPTDAALINVDWGDAPQTTIKGVLNAQTAHYRLGRTIFDGAPPRIDFNMTYKPVIRTTRLVGDLAGGRVLLNNAFVLSEAKGAFETDIVGDTIAAKAALSTMRIAQNVKLEMVAPVAVAGEATLAADVAHFDFTVRTPKGAPLGVGEGSQQVLTGRGEAVFDSGLLTFAPGLQPDRLLPALSGIISGATGATEGRARFEWSPGDMGSSATINLDNVTFRGPGVAVTKTEGVTGKIVFSSLSPVATAGEQTLSISKVDMDALKLENGAMRFALPGDDTLKIIEAEFPWFGGTIGAYNSQMSIAGGKSETTLQIDNVNFSDLLAYIKVDGLSGEGSVEGVLPISFEGGRARINNGILSSKGSGVVRYEGKATNAASQSNEQSALAFEILRELRFDKLSATIDGPLDGTINFKIFFEGRSDIPVKAGGKTQRVDSPVKYRLTINAPLLSLIEQAILSTDVKLQIERAKQQEAEGAANQ